MDKKNKRGIEMNMLGYWIIGIVLLIIVLGGYLILKGKGIGAIEFLKNIFRLRG